MAKDTKRKFTPEEIRREKEKKEREQREEKLQKERQKEKVKKRREMEIRRKAKEKKELKRIHAIVNLPFKLLLQVTMLITIMSFILIYFATATPLIKTIFYCFLIFTLFYLGAGLVMVGIFYVISVDKEKEMEEQRLLEEEAQQLEQKQKEEEMEELHDKSKVRDRERGRLVAFEESEPIEPMGAGESEVPSDTASMPMPDDTSSPFGGPIDIDSEFPNPFEGAFGAPPLPDDRFIDKH